jgi:hypothetical protein
VDFISSESGSYSTLRFELSARRTDAFHPHGGCFGARAVAAEFVITTLATMLPLGTPVTIE